MNWEAIVCTIALVLVAGACLAHLKSMGRGAHLCERLGFSITFGGAVGSAAEWWWPSLEAYHGDVMFVVGCGVIAFSLLVRHLRDGVAYAIGAWDGIERRRCRESEFITSRWERPQ